MGIIGMAVAVGVSVGSGVEVELGVKLGNWVITLVKVVGACGEDAGAAKLHPTSESTMERMNTETAQRDSDWRKKIFLERFTSLIQASPGNHTGAVEFVPI
jgi:hypothetical protein